MKSKIGQKWEMSYDAVFLMLNSVAPLFCVQRIPQQMLCMILGKVTLVQLSKFSVDCLLWLHFLRLGTANSTANLLDDVEGNPCGKTFSPIFQANFS